MMYLCVYTTDRDRVGIKRYDALYCYIMTIDGMMNDDLRRYDIRYDDTIDRVES